MENNSNDQSLFNINFDENVKSSLRDLASWAGIAAILSLVGSVLGLVQHFAMKNKLDRAFGDLQVQRSADSGGLISALISLGIGIALFVFLNKFARMTKAGVAANDAFQINEGLSGLATYFKVLGVLIIIVLVFFALAMLVALGSGI
ncbi:MAG: hypothetical protein IAE96_00130 [Chitinophagaceae bacterium]|nr:hypothetical protein [Chitinophagaceae bacterium]